MFIKLISPLIYLISLFFPKRKDIWLFGAWFGQRYSDNSKYLFEEVSDYQKDEVIAVWITSNINVYLDLKSKNYNCELSTSLKGIFLQLRAGVFICCVNSKDFFLSTITPRNTFIQLWHGSPIKKINYDVFTGSRKYLNQLRSFLVDDYDYIVSPSDAVDNLFQSAFNIPKSKIIRSGYPRCDGLFSSNNKKKTIINSIGCDKKNKIAFYLPTHRADGGNKKAIIDLVQNLGEIDHRLDKSGITLVVKPHFYDSAYLTPGWMFKNILVLEDGEEDVYKLLSVSDALITDYSSIMFDYEVTGKPILLYLPDLEYFSQHERELYFSSEKFLVNFNVTPSGLMDELNSSLFSEVNQYPLPYKLKFNEYYGSENSKKLAEKLKSLLL